MMRQADPIQNHINYQPMMMKFYALTIAGMLMTGLVFSQQTTVEIGPEFRTNGEIFLWNHLYSDASGHYVLMVEEKGLFFSFKKFNPTLQKFDRAFNLSMDKQISVDGSDIMFDDMLYAQQKFVLGTRTDDKKAKKVNISATLVGLDAASQKTQLIASIPYQNNDTYTDQIKWKVSADTSKIALAAWADNGDKKLQTALFVSVQGNKLSNIWKQSVTLPYTQENLNILDMVVTNTGQVFLKAKVYFDKKDLKKQGGIAPLEHKMVIFSLDGSGDKAKEINPEMAGKFVTDISLAAGKQGELYCAGLFTDEGKGVVQGFFCHRLNGQTGAVEQAINKELSAADIKNFSTEKDKAGNEGLDADFEMKDLILRSDGGMVLVAEETFTSYESYSSGGTINTYSVYNTNDLMVCSISPAGTVTWIKTVPKSQAFGETQQYNSYALMVSGDNLCFVYNDDKDNVNKPTSAKAKPISSFKDAVAGMFTISSDGKMDRQMVFGVKKETGLLLSPGKSKQISANELFFITTGTFKLTGKNMYRMGVIKGN